MRKEPFSPRQCGWTLVCVLCTSLVAMSQEVASISVDGVAGAGFFGFSVAGLPDVDGDGCDEFVVGAMAEGACYCFSGVDGGLIHAVAGGITPDEFGGSVASAGDVDGDGFGDVVVGAPYDSQAGQASGRVHVFSGRNGTLIWSVAGEAVGDRFGLSVGGLGDINGDGLCDILVGAPFHDSRGPDSGRLYAMDGATSSVIFSIDGESPGDYLGYACDGLEDVDADGVLDVLVGARRNDNASGSNAGRVYVHSGRTGRLLHVLDGESGGDQFGAAVASVGDVTGDGAGDFVVGALQNDHGGVPNVGRAYAYSGCDGRLLFEWTGEKAQDRFGAQVAGAGDMNGDGVGDFAVSSPFHGSKQPLGGRVYVFCGMTGELLGQFDAENAGDLFGSSLAGDIDVNGDGFSDLVVGALGHDSQVPDTGRSYVLSLPTIPTGPYLGPCGAGEVGLGAGGPFDVLFVDSSPGSIGYRRVDLDLGVSFTVDVQQPSTNPVPAPFMLFMYWGRVTPALQFPLLPGANAGYVMCFPPPMMVPGIPSVLVAGSFGGPALAHPPSAPWSATLPGAPIPVEFALQGLIAGNPGSLKVTNAVAVRIR